VSLPHCAFGFNQLSAVHRVRSEKQISEVDSFFWNAALPHIYRSLKQMEKEGWIVSTIEQQSGKPNRKVYRITGEGERRTSPLACRTAGRTGNAPLDVGEGFFREAVAAGTFCRIYQKLAGIPCETA